jgi:hypothetical protein
MLSQESDRTFLGSNKYVVKFGVAELWYDEVVLLASKITHI